MDASTIGARIVELMRSPSLAMAGGLASSLALRQRGSEWCHGTEAGPWHPLPEALLSAPKIRHDIAQFRYLQSRGALDSRFDAIIAAFEAALRRIENVGDNARVAMTPEEQLAMGAVYGRIVHLADVPRVDAALSRTWSRQQAQLKYTQGQHGIVVIDDFLSPVALAGLRRFCLESTVWSANRYAHGRLGAFFFAGFNCPLLLQVAEEIREAFPAIIGAAHPLRQLWGFKNTCELPPDSTIHADFAAVNVNFWITPDGSNLDPASGGMVVYDIDAPADWDFATYNERIDIIREYLAARRARAIRVPYRQNRAIIFNSDLFHATEGVRFDPAYPSHRVNITMLYGDRADDAHRPPRHQGASPGRPGWRSAAFSRRRR